MIYHWLLKKIQQKTLYIKKNFKKKYFRGAKTPLILRWLIFQGGPRTPLVLRWLRPCLFNYFYTICSHVIVMTYLQKHFFGRLFHFCWCTWISQLRHGQKDFCQHISQLWQDFLLYGLIGLLDIGVKSFTTSPIPLFSLLTRFIMFIFCISHAQNPSGHNWQ